jgi:hypothetical protein
MLTNTVYRAQQGSVNQYIMEYHQISMPELSVLTAPDISGDRLIFMVQEEAVQKETSKIRRKPELIYLLVSSMVYFLVLKLEAISSPETTILPTASAVFCTAYSSTLKMKEVK